MITLAGWYLRDADGALTASTELRRTYSEIVWLGAGWTAPTWANANRTTGLPNSYAEAARLALRLREIREQAGLTQEQLAARARVAVATVRKIETGAVVEPGYFTVIGLLDALGVTDEELRLLASIVQVF